MASEANVIESFLVAVGFELDDDSRKELKGFSDQIGKFTDNLLKMGAALAAGGAAVTAFVAKVSSDVDKLGKRAETINTSVENIDALGFAMSIATGESDSMTESLERLTRTASEAARGAGAGVEAFGILGLGVTEDGQIKDTMQLLMQTADAIVEIGDESRQLELADKLGLADMILLLRKGSAGIRELVEEGRGLAVVTEEDTRKAAEFMDSTFRVLGRIGKGLSVLFTSTLSPVITEIVEGFKDWFMVNKDIIRQDVVTVAENIGAALKIAASFIAAVAKGIAFLVKLLGGLQTVLIGIITVLGLLFAYNLGGLLTTLGSLVGWLTAKFAAMGFTTAASFAATQAGILATGVVLLLIIGLIDEIIVMFQGGKTVIGDFWAAVYEAFPQFEEGVTMLAEGLLWVWDLLKDIAELLTNPGSSDAWLKVINKIESAIDDFGNSVIEIIQTMVIGIVDILNRIPGVDIDTAAISEFGRRVTGAGSVNDVGSAAIQARQELASGNGGITLNQGAVTININGADANNAEAIRRVVADEMGAVNRETLRNLQRRVAK